jgi:hypothetical protein
MKKRLLKDLPFANLKAGMVISEYNSGYCIKNGETYYSTGGSSSNGITCFEESEEAIIKTIWDNPEWFTEAVLNKITLKARRDSVTLSFDSIDIEDAELLAKGIMALIPKLAEYKNYSWGKFENIETKMS